MTLKVTDNQYGRQS